MIYKLYKIFLVSIFFYLSSSFLAAASIHFIGQSTLLSGNTYYLNPGESRTLAGATLTIQSNAIFEIRVGATLNTGNTLTFNGGRIDVWGTINITSFAGRITNGIANVVFNLYNSGTINIIGTQSATEFDSEIDLGNSVFNNYGGTLNISNGGFFYNESNTSPKSSTFNQFSGKTNISSKKGFRNAGNSGSATLNIFGGEFNVYSGGSIVNGYVSAAAINVSGSGKIILFGSTLSNGVSGAGTLRLDISGSIINLGGTISNGNGSSSITVNSGGYIDNYLGIINNSVGSLTINKGGIFYNVRGGYPSRLTLNSGCIYIDSNEINLRDDLKLDYAWTVTNVSVINGNGHSIDLGSANAALIIGKKAALELRDVVFKNVSNNQIRCLDTYSTLSIDKCTWFLDGNYSFTKGRIYIAGDWNIVGNNHSFSYQSRKESSLAEDANLNFFDTTFIYDINISITLFNPLSSSSNICLQNSTLQASQNWKPAAGTILADGNVTLKGIATLDLQNISNIKQHGSITRIGNVLL